jgi:hypothetical protein
VKEIRKEGQGVENDEKMRLEGYVNNVYTEGAERE